MGDREEEEVPDAPATWENVAVGAAKELVGRMVGNDELIDDGEEQEDIAHEVRKEFNDEHHD